MKQRAEKKVVAAAKKKAYKIYKKTKKPGVNFAKLAKEYSEGPSAGKGGDLGFFTSERMVPEFSKAAFNMKKGTVSKPVRTQFGWHIIKVINTKAAKKTMSLEDAKKEIAKKLNDRKLGNALRQFKADKTVEWNVVKRPENIVDNPRFNAKK